MSTRGWRRTLEPGCQLVGAIKREHDVHPKRLDREDVVAAEGSGQAAAVHGHGGVQAGLELDLGSDPTLTLESTVAA